MTDSQRLDRILACLERIATKLDAPKPPPKTYTPEELAAWRAAYPDMRRQDQAPGDFPESSTTREAHFRRSE